MKIDEPIRRERKYFEKKCELSIFNHSCFKLSKMPPASSFSGMIVFASRTHLSSSRHVKVLVMKCHAKTFMFCKHFDGAAQNTQRIFPNSTTFSKLLEVRAVHLIHFFFVEILGFHRITLKNISIYAN